MWTGYRGTGGTVEMDWNPLDYDVLILDLMDQFLDQIAHVFLNTKKIIINIIID